MQQIKPPQKPGLPQPQQRPAPQATQQSAAPQRQPHAPAQGRPRPQQPANANAAPRPAPQPAPAAAPTGEADRRNPLRNRTDGYVIECDGARATIAAKAGISSTESQDYWAVGQLITLQVGENRVVGMLYAVDVPVANWNPEGDNVVHIKVELVGEIIGKRGGPLKFSGGITTYPYLGAIAHRIRTEDLAAIYHNTDANAVKIGHLSQNPAIPAQISIDGLVNRHFAVVGTTGVGKSTTVTLLLRKIVQARPDLRILILDPHNEFACAFPDIATTVTASDLDLPFWLFKMEEFAEVIFQGRPSIPEELDALRELIPQAKGLFARGSDKGGLRKADESKSYTADTPVPYRMADLIGLIDDRAGKLNNSELRPALRSLRTRIETVVNDPRFSFMFANKTIHDTIESVVGRIFRVPMQGRPITAFQLSGIPSEVVNSVASVLCRMAFDLAMYSESKLQTLVVCEEAHRYIPADSSDGFAPTRASIARIAKEGRKYGVYLGIITQRPGELDATILSQCNTFLAMRLGNEEDQEVMRKAISGASASNINFLSSLADREAIAFGKAVATPMRLKFESVPRHLLPGNNLFNDDADDKRGVDNLNITDIISAMRRGKGRGESGDESGETGNEWVAPAEHAPEQPVQRRVVERRPVATVATVATVAMSQQSEPAPAAPGAVSGNDLRRKLLRKK